MKRLIKIIAKVLLCIAAVVILFLLSITIYHHFMLSKESSLIKPNGSLVSVDGHKMHVYTEGAKGTKPTLIIMSAYATPAPVYDYKILYSKLSDKYHTAVIEKFGYGYSDVSGLPRDISTLVKEDREALKLAGENGPYVLLPHSMSGLEALYWAQHYPSEISSIVGLDMSLPEGYQKSSDDVSSIKFTQAMTFMGFHRIPFLYSASELGLTGTEIDQSKYLTYKMAMNDDVLAEGKVVYENAIKVKSGGIPKIPILLFSSNGKGLGDNWVQHERSYANKSDKSKFIQLDCSHMIHYYKSDYIAQQIKIFLQSTIQK